MATNPFISIGTVVVVEIDYITLNRFQFACKLTSVILLPFWNMGNPTSDIYNTVVTGITPGTVLARSARPVNAP